MAKRRSRLEAAFVDTFSYQADEVNTLANALFEQRVNAWGGYLDEQTQRYGCTQPVRRPTGVELRELRRMSNRDAESIARTFNRDLERHVARFRRDNPRARRGEWVSSLDQWSRQRAQWKDAQIAVHTQMSARHYARKRFGVRNGLNRTFRCVGPPPVCKICIEAMSFVAVDEDYMSRHAAPFHPNCIHEWVELGPPDETAKGCDELWFGDGDVLQTPQQFTIGGKSTIGRAGWEAPPQTDDDPRIITLKEANSIIKERFPNAEVHGMNRLLPTDRTMVTRRLESLSLQYPETAQTISKVSITTQLEARAYFPNGADNVAGFAVRGPIPAKPAHELHIMADIFPRAGRLKVNFDPRAGGNTISEAVWGETVITHEFGHIYQYWLEDKTFGRALLPFLRADDFGTARYFLNTPARLLLEYGGETNISTYAMTNNREVFAEMFTLMHHVPRRRWTNFARKYINLVHYIERNVDNMVPINNASYVRGGEITDDMMAAWDKLSEDTGLNWLDSLGENAKAWGLYDHPIRVLNWIP